MKTKPIAPDNLPTVKEPWHPSKKLAGKFVTLMREQQKMTRYALAKEAGITQRCLVNIEEASAAYTFLSLIKVLTVLKCGIVFSTQHNTTLKILKPKT